MARHLKEGEYVYLVPTLHTAPAAAYRHPLCEVVCVIGGDLGDLVQLALSDGTTITTDVRNTARQIPDRSMQEPRRSSRPARLDLPEGYEEVTLW